MLNSCVFCRHTKGIPAHGMQHVETLHSTETRNNVTNGIVTYMAHVQVAGRIGEHLQHIGFRFGIILFYLKGFVFFPVFLPFGFNVMGSIFVLKHFFTS